MPEYPDLFRSVLEVKHPNLIQTYDDLRSVLKSFPDGADLEALYSLLQDLRNPRANMLSPAVAYQLSRTKQIGLSEIIEILGTARVSESTALLAALEEFILASCEITDEKSLFWSYDQLFQVFGGTWWKRGGPGSKSGSSIYRGMVACRRGSPGFIPQIPIVTTNYDRVVERYLFHRQADLVSGFKLGPGERMLLYPSVLRAEPESPSIKLVKLHGSINWKRTEDGSITQTSERPGVVTSRWERISGDAMIFPTRNKFAANAPFFELLSIFSDWLKDAEFWLVIGYSFRDDVLRRLFLDSLGEQRYMIVLSPNASSHVESLRGDAPPTTTLEHIIPVDAAFGTTEGFQILRAKIEEGF